MELLELIGILNTLENTIEWCRQNRLIRREPPPCPEPDCPRQMTEVRRAGIDAFVWRCPLHKNRRQSLRDGSFFSRSKISLQKWVLLLFLWSHRIFQQTTEALAGLSHPTVVNPVEAYWKRAKDGFKRMSGTYADLVQSHLYEFMFRERYGRSSAECFHSMTRAIAQQFPCP